MKNQHIIAPALLVGLITLLSWNSAMAQSKREKEALENQQNIASAIQNQDFTFRAQAIVPLSGPRRELSGYYDLQVTGDKLVSFLPYMGRIYMPPIDPAEGPLRFTSKDFSYTERLQKKGGWNISIKPADVRSVREFMLSVSQDGYATLQVSGNDRQPVTFYGYIVENGNG